MKRIKIIRDPPNPLFELWLEEWRDKAKNESVKNHFSNALKSLKKYPLPLKTGRDCIILQNFNKSICTMLDMKLSEYEKQNKKSEDSSNIQTLSLQNEIKNQIYPSIDKTSSASRDEPPNKISIVDRVSKLKEKKQSFKKNPPTVNDTDDILVSKTYTLDEFDIILLVDTQETSGTKTKSKDDPVVSMLTNLGVSFEVRRLNVGDFTWVARCKISGFELLLPYIVERKRIDDLGLSIRDGRFHEQKFRLKQTGIKNVMYIVENHEKCQGKFGMPFSNLMQASVNCLIQDKFIVKYTNDLKDTINYLYLLTIKLSEIYQNKKLICSNTNEMNSLRDEQNIIYLRDFSTFNKKSIKKKNFTVRQMFIRHLLQLKGMSLDRAVAVVECYPTPTLLISAFDAAGEDAEKLLSKIEYGEKKRLIGAALSKTIYQLYKQKILF